MRLFLLATVFVISTMSAALAGNAVLEKGGKKYSLSCTNAGCFLAEKKSFFSSGPKQRLGAGGVINFNAWMKKLKSQGYK